MSYSVTEINGVKIYNLSAGKTLPQFLQDSYETHKSLRYDQEFRRRIELIQDFDFPVSCNQVQVTPDEQYIIATGVYPPTIKIYDTHELSMKCLRGVDSEVVKFCVLSEDFSKLVFACSDRNIEFHAQYGKHHKMRVPRQPRDIKYNPFTCDLLVAASSNEIYRVSLDEGQFIAPFQSAASAVNVLDFNKHLNLLISGGTDGIVEFFDYRLRKKVNSRILFNGEAEISQIRSDPSGGLLYAVGSSNGEVRLYDARQPENQLLEVRHHYRLPINSIQFHERSRSILSSTQKVVKINNRDTGALFTNLEPSSDVNMCDLCQESGLLLVAAGEPRIGTYFIPQLDNAPKWCPFLENITEELEEEQNTKVYDEFKFLNYEDLEKLNCTNLIGTKMLKQHLHGYIMHMKLYLKLKEKYDPFSFEEYRKELINRKIDEKTNSRVKINKNKPKVNQQFAEELLKRQKNIKTQQQHQPQQQQQQQQFDPTLILQDDRFKVMFQDSKFLIDKNSKEYVLSHPSESAMKRIKKQTQSDDEYEPEEAKQNEGEFHEEEENQQKNQYKQQQKNEFIENEDDDDDDDKAEENNQIIGSRSNDDNNIKDYLNLEKKLEKKDKLLTLKKKKIRKDLESKRQQKTLTFESKLQKSSTFAKKQWKPKNNNNNIHK